jgi:hypothetical protein
MGSKVTFDSIKPNDPKTGKPADAAPAADEPATTKGGTLTQAWTDDKTGQTYMPGEKVEGADVK